MSLRVAFLMPGIGVVERGAEHFLLDLCRALAAEHGVDVTLFCRGAAPLPHRRIRAVARDNRALTAAYRASRLGRKVLDTLFLDPLNVEWSTAALAALPALWRGRYDVAVLEGGLAGGWVGRLLRRFRGTAFVDVAHGLSPKWEGAFARQKPDRVVAFTRAGAEMIARLAPAATVRVIPHGVDLDHFRPDGPRAAPALARPLVVTAGEVEEHKRMERLVAALATVERGSLLVLGGGPRASALDRLADERLGATRYLRRRVPRDDMPRWLRAADCFALPSRSESFGLAYLEALACGVACVAPDDAVRREVIGDAGIFVSDADPDAYVAALLETAARDWGEVPRRRAERFPFAATVAAYADLLAEVAQ